jgi:hypothetical protein
MSDVFFDVVPFHISPSLPSSYLNMEGETYIGSSSSSHSSTSYSQYGHFTKSEEGPEGVNTNPAFASYISVQDPLRAPTA